MPVDDRLTRWLKVLAVIALAVVLAAAVLAFLNRIIAVVIVLAGAVFFAYLIYPLVRRFARRMPRWLAILCVYALLAVVLGLIGAFIGPIIGAEARALGTDFPNLMQRAKNALLNANIAIITAIPLEARETAVKIFAEAGTSLQKSAGTIAGQALGILLSVASIVTAFIIIPILAFYILMDLERLRSRMLRLIPASGRVIAQDIMQDVDTVLGGFIRGQIIVCAMVAILVTVMLLILQIKYAFLIGVFAGVVDIIPYLGAFAGAIPALIIAAVTHGFGWVLLVAAGFIATYQIEGHIIAPNVVGQRVGLTPLMVIVAILAGAELGGILGMFVAVPLAGIVRALATRFLPPLELESTETKEARRKVTPPQ